MRAFDRDLIRGGHYGQRSCEPHAKAEHMAAPTKTALVKKVLANPEPSTQATTARPMGPARNMAMAAATNTATGPAIAMPARQPAASAHHKMLARERLAAALPLVHQPLAIRR